MSSGAFLSQLGGRHRTPVAQKRWEVLKAHGYLCRFADHLCSGPPPLLGGRLSGNAVFWDYLRLVDLESPHDGGLWLDSISDGGQLHADHVLFLPWKPVDWAAFAADSCQTAAAGGGCACMYGICDDRPDGGELHLGVVYFLWYGHWLWQRPFLQYTALCGRHVVPGQEGILLWNHDDELWAKRHAAGTSMRTIV